MVPLETATYIAVQEDVRVTGGSRQVPRALSRSAEANEREETPGQQQQQGESYDNAEQLNTETGRQSEHAGESARTHTHHTHYIIITLPRS